MNAVSALCLALAFYSQGTEHPLDEERIQFACSHMESLVTAADQFEVPHSMLMALVYHESTWNTDAQSKAGACGLTQVISRWTPRDIVPRYSCKELKANPDKAFLVAVGMLYNWIVKYKANEDLHDALRCYNRGNYCLKGWGKSYLKEIIDYQENFEPIYETFLGSQYLEDSLMRPKRISTVWEPPPAYNACFASPEPLRGI